MKNKNKKNASCLLSPYRKQARRFLILYYRRFLTYHKTPSIVINEHELIFCIMHN